MDTYRSISFIPVGTKVKDDLTGEVVTIIGVTYQDGTQGLEPGAHRVTSAIGYWVNHEWAGGGRHPWEITELPELPKEDVN